MLVQLQQLAGVFVNLHTERKKIRHLTHVLVQLQQLAGGLVNLDTEVEKN